MGRVLHSNIQDENRPQAGQNERSAQQENIEYLRRRPEYHEVQIVRDVNDKIVQLIPARKRKKCKLCLFLQFSKDALVEVTAKRYGRARFYNKQASFYSEDIKNATRLSVLHACSPEHKELMIEIRKASLRQLRAVEIVPREAMIESVQKDYERAIQNYATLLLTHSLNSPEVVKAAWWISHYRAVRAQRRRRLREVEGR